MVANAIDAAKVSSNTSLFSSSATDGSRSPLFKKREFVVYERRESLDDGTLVRLLSALSFLWNSCVAHLIFLFILWQLDPAGWLPKCFVNKLNTKLVMIIENLKKLAQTCPVEREM
ncbi:hypothetical protein BHM03_00059873 [Ensete ventricosum]|nr:hypothetical protein BHM03_00059873 [Ensete ventricosum]